MDPRQSDLVTALFAEITSLLERAHDRAVDGQSPHINDDAHIEIAESLAAELGDIAVLASAAVILARRPEVPD